MATKTRRQQTPKSGNRAMMQAFQEIRRSSASEPHRNRAKYSRNVKHRARQYDY